jgi:ATP phosphoribosyltransferase
MDALTQERAAARRRTDSGSRDGLTVAVAKGRILSEALPLLERAGLKPLQDPQRSRKLILATADPGVRLVIVRAADVATYVQHGAADVGITGKDLLMELDGGDLYELLDLRVARCRLVVAGPGGMTPAAGGRRLRVATKYVNVSRRHFAANGVQAEIIRLYGSMELAPLAGLADRIVDLVDTGGTLRANGLAEYDEIAAISARLVVNRASMKIRHKAVTELAGLLRQQVSRS